MLEQLIKVSSRVIIKIILSFPTDLMDYDSEIYANGALESGTNQRYQQILQQRSPIENSRQLQGYSTRDYRHNPQVKE